VALRVINIGRLSFWVDELNHAYVAKGLLEQSGPMFLSTRLYSRARLYTILVAISFRLFGVGEAQARLPSIIFGTAAVPLIFFLGLRWFSPPVGLVSAFLLAFNTSAITWSRTCRMYTFFQAIFLIFLYVLYRGLEYEPPQGKKPSQHTSGVPWYRFPPTWNIHWVYLLIAAVLFIVAFHVQAVTVLTFFGLLAYILLRFTGLLLQRPLDTNRLLKYSTFFIAIASLVVPAVIFFDADIRFSRAIRYVPTWARWQSEDPWVYFRGLGRSLWVFFFIGGAEIIRSRRRPGIYLLVMFLVPFFMLSFLFAWKSTRYIFHLFPCFLIVSAYGIVLTFRTLVAWAERTIDRVAGWRSCFRSYVANGTILILLMIFFLSCRWFQYGIRIPWLQHGRYRGTIAHYNWRSSCKYVAARVRPGDIIISSLPLATLYYGLPEVHYSLNFNQLGLARSFDIRDDQGRYIDPYTSVEIITDLPTLARIIADHPRGWLIIDALRFSPPYITTDIRDYILSTLDQHLDPDDDTVRVFSWDHKSKDL